MLPIRATAVLLCGVLLCCESLAEISAQEAISQIATDSGVDFNSADWEAKNPDDVTQPHPLDQMVSDAAYHICTVHQSQLVFAHDCWIPLSFVFGEALGFAQKQQAISAATGWDSRRAQKHSESIRASCQALLGNASDPDLRYIYVQLRDRCIQKSWDYIDSIRHSRNRYLEQRAYAKQFETLEGQQTALQLRLQSAKSDNQSLRDELERVQAELAQLRQQRAQSTQGNQSTSPSGASPAGASGAPPIIVATTLGSSIMFTISRSAERDFRCNMEWSIGYTEYGVGKSKSISKVILIQPKQEGVAMIDQTTYANLRLTSFRANCS